MAMDAAQKFKEPLTEDRLFGWHAALFLREEAAYIKLLPAHGERISRATRCRLYRSYGKRESSF